MTPPFTQRLAELEKLAEMAQAQRRIETFELSIAHHVIAAQPWPMWCKRLELDPVKGRQYRMLFVNPAYERRWGIKASGYVGKLDSEVWPREIAQAFAENDDEAVAMSPAPFVTDEMVPDLAGVERPTTDAVPWTVTKLAVDTGGSIHVIGSAFRLDDGKLVL